MGSARRVTLCIWAGLFLLWSIADTQHLSAASRTTRQQSLDEWRSLTAPTAPAPRVFVKGNQVRFYFPTSSGIEEFSSEWSHGRIPSSGFRVRATVLRWNQKLAKMPEGHRGWREAVVISGQEWRRLATNLMASLAPPEPLRAAYYQSFLADRVLYRDAAGNPRWADMNALPPGVIIEHRFSVEETLEVLARTIEDHLARSHPGDSLFLMMAPNADRFTTPLLLDRQQRRCLSLSPAALYDNTDQKLGFNGTARSLSALLLEGHGIALIKNPVSSAARLADLGVQTALKLLRLPLPGPGSSVPPLAPQKGMNLADWEKWLDHYTGTQRELGTMKLLIDGDSFFNRLQDAISNATDHIYFNIYIFDRDDVAVNVADQLKQKSGQVDVRIIFDKLGSIAAGMAPPATPLPEDFVAPKSIGPYLRDGSKVHVHPFLNPWFSADHTKVCLIDGNDAWVGGMNVGREYRYEWHDLMVELRGPVVRSLEKEFSRCWAHEGPLGDLAYVAALVDGPEPKKFPAPTNAFPVRLLPTKTAWKPFSSAVLEALSRAEECVYVENPYLFDKRVIRALVRARQRGVDVRVILPRVNDFKAGGRSNMVIANYLIEHGVRVFFYPGMTHVKALLVDGWSCLGSGNLNHLSLRINQEQNIATSDQNFAETLNRELFAPDFARSYELKDTISVDWVDFLAEGVLENF